MKITIIHGQAHKGSTFHVTESIKEKLEEGKNIVYEFFLPKDGPAFCTGCFNCIQRGEENCPHAEKVQKILSSILCSDIIIIDSPTYCFEMTGQLKTLFDHLAYIWMSHRPRKEMFAKVGIIISTTAGGGAGRVTKSIARQLSFWGVPKIYQLPFTVNAACWEDVSAKVKEKITRKTRAVSKSVKSRINRLNPGFKTKLIFNLMRKMQNSNNWNMTDRNYWQNNKWLEEVRPWG